MNPLLMAKSSGSKGSLSCSDLKSINSIRDFGLPKCASAPSLAGRGTPLSHLDSKERDVSVATASASSRTLVSSQEKVTISPLATAGVQKIAHGSTKFEELPEREKTSVKELLSQLGMPDGYIVADGDGGFHVLAEAEEQKGFIEKLATSIGSGLLDFGIEVSRDVAKAIAITAIVMGLATLGIAILL